MAGDLIPPPSPARRPPPVAAQPPGPPRFVELPPEPGVEGLEPFAPPPSAVKLPPSRFRNRFGFLIGALAGALIAAVLVLVAVLSSGSDDEGLAAGWSAWQPSDSSVEGGARQIAEKVGAEYTHANGQQLVKVTGTPLDVNVALRPASGAIAVYDGTGVVYELNGLGPNGSIKGGTPSAQRLQLVRREALELALYTFRYLPDVEMVVTLLPPPPPKADAGGANGLLAPAPDPNEMTAIFHRPGDLKAQMQMPLELTVPAQAPMPEEMGGPQGAIVDQLTNANMFRWSLTRAQGSTTYLVLDRPTTP